MSAPTRLVAAVITAAIANSVLGPLLIAAKVMPMTVMTTVETKPNTRNESTLFTHLPPTSLRERVLCAQSPGNRPVCCSALHRLLVRGFDVNLRRRVSGQYRGNITTVIRMVTTSTERGCSGRVMSRGRAQGEDLPYAYEQSLIVVIESVDKCFYAGRGSADGLLSIPSVESDLSNQVLPSVIVHSSLFSI